MLVLAGNRIVSVATEAFGNLEAMRFNPGDFAPTMNNSAGGTVPFKEVSQAAGLSCHQRALNALCPGPLSRHCSRHSCLSFSRSFSFSFFLSLSLSFSFFLSFSLPSLSFSLSLSASA